MALLEKREGKDWLSIYHYPSLNMLISHNLTEIHDSDDIHWNQENGMITVWESATYNKICLVDPQLGLLKSFEPYQNALGLKSQSFKGRFM